MTEVMGFLATFVVKNTYHFIRLGNIRILPNGFDIATKPTNEQMRTMMSFAKAYAGETVYADYLTPDGGSVGKQYDRFKYDMFERDVAKYL